MFGERQTQPGVLIELRDDSRYPNTDAELESLRNHLWPTIEEANGIAPDFSRIFKDTVLFVSPDRPLPRTGKGTVMRKAATKLYADDIQRLYDTIEAGVGSNNLKGPKEWTQECLTSWLTAQTLDLMPNNVFSVEADLFEQGFNSLSATLPTENKSFVEESKGHRGSNCPEVGGLLDQRRLVGLTTLNCLTKHINV